MEFIITCICIVIGIVFASAAALYLSLRQPSPRHNHRGFVGGAIGLYAAGVIMAGDAITEIARLLPAPCGEEFTRGNCFLADGINIMFYVVLIPVILVAAYGLLLANYLVKTRLAKHTKSPAKPAANNSPLAKHSFSIALVGYVATAIVVLYTLGILGAFFSDVITFTRPQSGPMVLLALVGLVASSIAVIYRRDKHQIVSIATAVSCIIVLGLLLIVFGVWMQPLPPRPF